MQYIFLNICKFPLHRITTLKQELEVSKQKLEECTKTNCKLRDDGDLQYKGTIFLTQLHLQSPYAVDI